MNNCFQKKQSHVFWNFDSWFLSRGKKTPVSYCLYESKYIIMKKMKELVLKGKNYPLPNIVRCCLYESKYIVMKKLENKSILYPTLCLPCKFVCNITTKRFIDWGKSSELLTWNLNYFQETEKMLHSTQ